MPGGSVVLIDDGTLDTVLECQDCKTQIRYNWSNSEMTELDEFVEWATEDAKRTHECPT